MRKPLPLEFVIEKFNVLVDKLLGEAGHVDSVSAETKGLNNNFVIKSTPACAKEQIRRLRMLV